MDELYGQRAFPDGGSDSLDGPLSRVAEDEDSRLTGLQGIWLSFEWPPGAGAPIREEIAAGQVEPRFRRAAANLRRVVKSVRLL
jgi:hypothetical protein